MLRICFMRKRKTLHSVFTIRSVITLLENNYNVWCTLTKNIPDLTPMKVIFFLFCALKQIALFCVDVYRVCVRGNGFERYPRDSNWDRKVLGASFGVQQTSHSFPQPGVKLSSRATG